MQMRTAVLLLPILLAAELPPAFARPGDDLENSLRSDYANKVVTLRHAYEGKHLAFHSDGSLIGYGSAGSWTVDSQILVKQIKRRGNRLRLEGRRVCLVFDDKGKPYRDVLDWLAESKGKDRDKPADFFRHNDVDVEIELPSDAPDEQEVADAMKAVFLPLGGSVGEVVPDYWRAYFDRIEGRPHNEDPSIVTIKGMKQGIAPPRATYQPNPEFSEEARHAKYQGTMVLSVVVDPTGRARDVEIINPLGMGLDEKAVAKVSTWEFKPATKDGEPVPVRVAVEVSFRLY